MWSVVFFVIWPYVALAVFLVGHVWRWRTDQFGWTTRTSQLLESRWLHAASPLFHLGAFLVIAGHALGLIVPASWTRAVGLNEHTYHLVATTGGIIAGALLLIGIVLLIIRRFVINERLRIITTRWDIVLYVLLGATICIGMWATVAENVVGGGYDYRETISIWFRSLFALNPKVLLMASAPFAYQLHVVVAFGIIAIWPFTRLVHVWSAPIGYLFRPYVVYRSASATRRVPVTSPERVGQPERTAVPQPAAPAPGPALAPVGTTTGAAPAVAGQD